MEDKEKKPRLVHDIDKELKEVTKKIEEEEKKNKILSSFIKIIIILGLLAGLAYIFHDDFHVLNLF